jgi:putative ABC transport system ATP-binding protein
MTPLPDSEAGSPAIEAVDIVKVFDEGAQRVEVLHGVSLSVRPGEVVALEGPSGSGKTTLLSIMGCILTATSGSIRIRGRSLAGASRERLREVRRREIGFVFQQFNLFPALTALENVEYALNIKGVKGGRAREQASEVLEKVDMGERESFLPRDLSGGQKQRVAIARALSGAPGVLLADEPTANLDSETGRRILELFRRLAKEDSRGLVIVTHDPKVRDVADRTVSIRDGRISASDASGQKELAHA